MRNKILSFIVTILIFGLLIWIISEISKPDPLKVGSDMPLIKYTNNDGVLESFTNNLQTKTMVLLFDINCESCKYQLDVIFNNIVEFKKVNLLLLTANKFDVKSDSVFYKRLSNNSFVHFGNVNKNEFKKQFGTVRTPTTFIFDEKNKLTEKIYGESKIEKLLQYL